MHVLATDLDGTFLAGSDTARQTLIQHFLQHPERRLLYVTGRSVNSVLSLIRAGRLPIPDGMICDVGTTVACAQGKELPGAAHAAAEAAWQDRSTAVQAALQGWSGLHLQEDFGPRRVSYTFSAGADLEGASAQVRALGLEPLVSDNLYFDVLPPGINKGSTLQRWLNQHGWGLDDALAAGDTRNDLALLSAGCRAVMVGNAEAALRQELPVSERIYRARGEGCDGILEACAHFALGLEAV
ncbi:MAG: HAD family hydrolase [Oceanococcaceae bacterium]